MAYAKRCTIGLFQTTVATARNLTNQNDDDILLRNGNHGNDGTRHLENINIVRRFRRIFDPGSGDTDRLSVILV